MSSLVVVHETKTNPTTKKVRFNDEATTTTLLSSSSAAALSLLWLNKKELESIRQQKQVEIMKIKKNHTNHIGLLIEETFSECRTTPLSSSSTSTVRSYLTYVSQYCCSSHGKEEKEPTKKQQYCLRGIEKGISKAYEKERTRYKRRHIQRILTKQQTFAKQETTQQQQQDELSNYSHQYSSSSKLYAYQQGKADESAAAVVHNTTSSPLLPPLDISVVLNAILRKKQLEVDEDSSSSFSSIATLSSYERRQQRRRDRNNKTPTQ